MQSICDLSAEELGDWLAQRGEPRYRSQQIFNWIYRRCVTRFDAMTNLSTDLRAQLTKDWPAALKLVRTSESQDQETDKFLWQLADGNRVESVLIRSEQRRTVCVSSQVGCPARCAFCASGKQGWRRNLSAGEIVEQVLSIHAREPITHVVFMGMGEPLGNLESVMDAIGRLHRDFGLSQRRITLSTVGVIEGIEALCASDLKVNLVLSLHAPNQRLRQKIIPYARANPLDKLLAAMERYATLKGRDITYEYILIAGFNDQIDHARELGQLLRGRQCTVNLIPYNPVVGLRLSRPKRAAIEAFRAELTRMRVIHTCRYTKGDDIAAACGQLALVD